jgi:hypothetical protein
MSPRSLRVRAEVFKHRRWLEIVGITPLRKLDPSLRKLRVRDFRNKAGTI